MVGQVINYPTVTHSNSDGSSVFFRIASNFNSMKTLTLLVHAGLSWCFHNPPNSDTDHRIFTIHMSSFCLRIHTAPHYKYITQGSTWEHRGFRAAGHLCTLSQSELHADSLIFPAKNPKSGGLFLVRKVQLYDKQWSERLMTSEQNITINYGPQNKL